MTFEGYSGENVLTIHLPVRYIRDYAIYKSALKILVESQDDLKTWGSVSVFRDSKFDDMVACNLEFTQVESTEEPPQVSNTGIIDILRNPKGGEIV